MNDDGSVQGGPMAQPKDNPIYNKDDPDGVICEAQKRLSTAIQAESDNYKMGVDDLNFLKGDQWPEKQRRNREADGRVVLTINKIPTFLQQVTNDQRQNRANIKVSAVSEDANNETASIIQGIVKHIEYESSADAAYDTAVNSAASIGFGYFRFKTEYESDTSFDQKIVVKRIRNAFTVHMDPGSVEADGHDQEWCFISERMSKAEFRAKYPKATATMTGFTVSGPGDNLLKDWMWESEVRVAEYYKFDYIPGMLYQYADGKTEFFPDEPEEVAEGEEPKPSGPPPGVEVVNKRATVTKKLMWYLLTPFEVLESTEIKCSWIPVFPVFGTEIDVDGRVYRSGLIRNAKDPAMMYNFWMTSATEEVAMRTKTPWIMAEGQAEGHENKWKQANMRALPYLEYKPVTAGDQLAPPPQRQPMADIPQGILTMAGHASDNLKQTTGLFDASIGAAGNATSGKQELAQQRQGNITNAHYMDNFFRTLRHAGRCLMEMIPAYYDAQRIVACRGDDGAVSSATINKWDELAQKFINDIRVGKYDLAVTPGPSYSTMRAEASDAMIQLAQKWPKILDIAGDKFVRAQSWPGADGIADRIAKTIPANLREGEDGYEGPPEIPDEAKQKITQLEQQVQELQEDANTNRTKLAIESSRAESNITVANINAENRKDVEELKGLVALLLARLPVPPALAEDVASEIAAPDAGNVAPPAPASMNQGQEMPPGG